MTNDGQAQEVHATVTGSGHSREPSNGDQAQRPNVLAGEVIDDEDIADEDAVIIEEVPAAPAGDEASPVSADNGVSPAAADDEPGRGGEPVRDQVTSAPARPGMPVGAGTPAGTTNAPADTNMAGDPERLHEQWAAIQSTFVDDPRGSVAAAAEFVTETIAALVASAKERERALRGEWDRDGVDTEGLRNALRSYRGLLDRLVRQ
jgi:hypothetical protein